MTDAQAREWLSILVAEEHGHIEQHHDATGRHTLRRDALAHALQAIEDRQALIDAADADSDCYSDQPGKMLPGTVAVVRLHVNEE